MKKIEKYVANDGCEFDNEEDAIERDRILEDVQRITKDLPKLPKNDGCNFANGQGYIQHDRSKLEAAQVKLYKLACKLHKGIKNYDLNSYAFARTLDDNDSPLYTLYIRIVTCVDIVNCREFGQPYYVNHQSEVKGGQINA